MLTLSRWKIILCIAAVLFGVLFTLPNILPSRVMASLPGWLPSQRLNLGLDLQGGSYLLLEVDVAALKKERLTNLVEDARGGLRDARIPFTALGQAGDSVSVRITDPAMVGQAITALTTVSQPLSAATKDVTVSRGDDQRVVLTLSKSAVDADSLKAVDQSIEIIRRRIDSLGTREPSITKQGATRIVVQAPGESDPEKLKRVIGQTAKLTFQMVDETVTPEEIAANRIPPGSMLLPSEDGYDSQLVVKRRALVTGEMLQDAHAAFSQQSGASVVTFRFNSQGARRFASATTQNVGRRFAIVLDNKVISAPNIREPITGGSGEISGSFTVESANELALVLKSGALPAPLNVEEQRTVGAELGADAIKAGQVSTLIGAVAIFLFIILAYGLFGWFAALALVINGLLIVALMSVTQATLTLPGIAGLVLTLAVAVDANVLIYERMRDEARAGRSPIAAADAGYTKAMSTIIDANVTSLVAAGIMFVLGAGPVKGFAWTLSIGIFTSMFTSILITQVLIALWFRAVRPKKLPIV